MPTVVAEMENVGFSYDGIRRVLFDISLKFEAGHTYALIGPNGAGKSTVIGLLTGSLRPQTGKVRILNGTALDFDQVACVRQELSLFPDLTVGENIALGRGDKRSTLIFARKDAEQFSAEYLRVVGAGIPVSVKCGQLSFPERQKVEIARALAAEPPILFLDEPTSALDKAAKTELYSVLRRVVDRGVTVVLVSHDPSEVAAVAAQGIYLREGRIVPAESGATAAAESRAVGASANGGVVERASLLAGTGPGAAINDHVAVAAGVDFDAVDVGTKSRDCSSAAHCDRHVTLTNTWTSKSAMISMDGDGRASVVVFRDALERTDAVAAICANGNSRRAFQFLLSGISVSRMRVSSADKLHDHLFPSLSVQENAVLLSSGAREWYVRYPTDEHKLLRRLQAIVPIQYASPTQPIQELSGGNQQRFVLAALIDSAPELLVLEEPMMGLDESSQKATIGILQRFVSAGRDLIVLTCFPDNYSMLARKTCVEF